MLIFSRYPLLRYDFQTSVLFNANRHEDAILLVQEPAATCLNADILACRIVEVSIMRSIKGHCPSPDNEKTGPEGTYKQNEGNQRKGLTFLDMLSGSRGLTFESRRWQTISYSTFRLLSMISSLATHWAGSSCYRFSSTCQKSHSPQ